MRKERSVMRQEQRGQKKAEEKAKRKTDMENPETGSFAGIICIWLWFSFGGWVLLSLIVWMLRAVV